MQIENLNALQDSVAKLSDATRICNGCGYCRCGDGAGEGKSSGSPPLQPGTSAVGYPEQIEVSCILSTTRRASGEASGAPVFRFDQNTVLACMCVGACLCCHACISYKQTTDVNPVRACWRVCLCWSEHDRSQKKLDDIFKMLVGMKDAGSKSSAVDAGAPRSQPDSPPPFALQFDTRRMSADTHGAGNSTASGRVITPNGGTI